MVVVFVIYCFVDIVFIGYLNFGIVNGFNLGIYVDIVGIFGVCVVLFCFDFKWGIYCLGLGVLLYCWCVWCDEFKDVVCCKVVDVDWFDFDFGCDCNCGVCGVVFVDFVVRWGVNRDIDY